jgi:hypothetical protein
LIWFEEFEIKEPRGIEEKEGSWDSSRVTEGGSIDWGSLEDKISLIA